MQCCNPFLISIYGNQFSQNFVWHFDWLSRNSMHLSLIFPTFNFISLLIHFMSFISRQCVQIIFNFRKHDYQKNYQMDSMKVVGLVVRFYNCTQPHDYFYWKLYLLIFYIFPAKNQDIGFYIHGTTGSKIWNIPSLGKLWGNNRRIYDG